MEKYIYKYLLGVWRDNYPTRRDTRLGSRERDDARFLDKKKILNEIYGEKLYFIQLKNKKCNNFFGAFWYQCILYESTHIFYMQ